MGEMDAGAVFDPTRTYRYSLWRRWDATAPGCLVVMLNPSTADEQTLDPTVRRCIEFAKSWGFGSLHVANIFALRSTDPAWLYEAADPVGPENDGWIRLLHERAGLTVAAWGVHGELNGRGGRASSASVRAGRCWVRRRSRRARGFASASPSRGTCPPLFP